MTQGRLIISQNRVRAQSQINQRNRTHGFVCLRNSGISKSKLQAAFDASQKLFSQSTTQKEKLKPIDPLSNTGYIGYGGEALNRSRKTDLKEAFNVRGNSASNGAFIGTPPSFQSIATELWDELQRLGNKYAICCALALGLDEQYFSKTLKDMDLSTLRMLHYPPYANERINLSL